MLLHQLESGSLLLFTFFMISDPKTTPRGRAARLGFAGCVAALAFALQHVAYARNPIIWALFLCAPLTPLLDALTETRQEKPACAPQPALSPSP